MAPNAKCETPVSCSVSTPKCTLCRTESDPSPTPAAMLGDALALLGRVSDMLDRADPEGTDLSFLPVAMAAERLRRHVEDLKRSAEAREPKR